MYKVGQILQELITHQDYVAIAVQEGFITMFMCYKKPYLNGIISFKKKNFEIRVKSYGSVINFSFHFEDDECYDLCYNPLLSTHIGTNAFRKEITHFLMLFIDADTGRIEVIRYQTLSIEFSTLLAGIIEKEQSRQSLILEVYNQEVEKLWKKYNSKQLFNNASENGCLIEEWLLPQEVVTLGDIID